MGDAVELSSYIVAFAGAAGTAQHLMSTGTQPMQIQKYQFAINISANYTVNSSTDVQMTVFGIGLQEKLSMGYSSSMGINVTCTIVPLVMIAAAAAGGGGGAGGGS